MLLPPEYIFSLLQNFMLFMLWEEIPEFKFHVKHEAAYLGGESLLSHVCKQTDNKFEVQNKI